ncbi:AP-3 complex subunit sigma-2 isoform X2 [Cuculus canorus]|uniref:AP-3 complex subunit sigma-2 isoform X2 n=1 Tax=Cuculus canorus TaxID=55661 RepID=UPI0023AAAFDB|nr:AP-3 complex subunit sigma-2 isoform X2 [Cuculus canorus]
MINAILVFNNHGKPRLVRFYQRLAEEVQQQIIRETFHLVLKRDEHICNFLECGSLFGGSDYKLIYRHYATLYFVFCVDSSESELGILDLIQGPKLNIAFQECLTSTEETGIMTSVSLLAMSLLVQPHVLWPCFAAAAAACSLTWSLVTNRTSRALSTQLLPSLCCTPGLCFPRSKTLYLSLLNFIRFLLASSSSLSRSSCRVSIPSKVSTSLLSLVS